MNDLEELGRQVDDLVITVQKQQKEIAALKTRTKKLKKKVRGLQKDANVSCWSPS